MPGWFRLPKRPGLAEDREQLTFDVDIIVWIYQYERPSIEELKNRTYFYGLACPWTISQARAL